MTRVAVCVATHQRPRELVALLASVDGLRVPPGVEVVVVVADNDPRGSAGGPTQRYAASGRFPLRAVEEPRPGIAAARDAALSRCPETDWVVFVDDDERVDAGWLAALMDTAATYDADVVAGPVLARLPEDAPRWAARGGWFERRRLATGTPVTWAATNNLLVRRAVLDDVAPGGFDERFGLSGGSDLELLTRLHRSGARMVWCDEALVEEDVPSTRVNRRWLVRRALRLGNVSGRLMRERRGRAAACAFFLLMLWRTARGVARSALRGSAPGKEELWPAMTAGGVALAVVGITVSEYGGPFLQRQRRSRGEEPPEELLEGSGPG